MKFVLSLCVLFACVLGIHAQTFSIVSHQKPVTFAITSAQCECSKDCQCPAGACVAGQCKSQPLPLPVSSPSEKLTADSKQGACANGSCGNSSAGYYQSSGEGSCSSGACGNSGGRSSVFGRIFRGRSR